MDHRKQILLHQINHCQQKLTWDCGISCVKMFLTNEQLREMENDYVMILGSLQINKSVWTIDMCYLLQKFKIKHKFYTITLGVNHDFTGNSYYNRIMNNDAERINRRFKDAESNGVEIIQQHVTCELFIEQLNEHGPFIVLVDSNRLVCEICGFNKLLTELECLWCYRRKYLGHYIVICGYNLQRNRFYYRNPSFKDRICATTFENLNSARIAFGTDEDVIFVHSR